MPDSKDLSPASRRFLLHQVEIFAEMLGEVVRKNEEVIARVGQAAKRFEDMVKDMKGEDTK